MLPLNRHSRMTRKVFLCAVGALLIGLAAPAWADPLPTPVEKPILTVSGHISVTNRGALAEFDRASLEALGTVSFTTTTPWYKEPVTFEGVPLARLMERLGARGETIVATALNDYSGEIPMEDVRNRQVILALKRDGRYMPVSDKGPLFIVYDFDHDPEAKKNKYYSRSVWQVVRLAIQ
ncbi:molybdopterin-dependent oxidoreductase [Azospirillum canadense]|uniref:molybdopterin-dependent oxidoreductase n=1 Tax=Azospirillum canadense TaxID=403962 RepID=UPI002226C992|nr:molybdopterin-dependent oxidoreductase [Azospirillum canadense]MCW2241678.1 hypothetical protein [Azospirillum canadense]